MRWKCGVVVGVILGLALHGAAARAATVTVQTGFTGGASPSGSFTPKEVTVAVGDTVTVVNGAGGGGAPHDLVWGDGAPGFPRMPMGTTVPANMAMWMSSRTFTAPGDFSYVCSFHQTIGMTGVVHVPAPAPGTPPAAGPAQPAPAAPADVTAPVLGATARATRRAVTLKVRLNESSRVTVVISRGKRTLARKRFSKPISGRATLRVPVRTRRGRLTVKVTAVDAAGNTTRRTLSLRVG
jgi:plastocyanin